MAAPSQPPLPAHARERTAASRWLLMQLVDGTFPSGGYAHSGGLEAALVIRGTRDIGAFLDEALWQAGRGALPFVRRGCEAPEDLAALDAACDATLTSHVARRASAAQGRALAIAARRIWRDLAGVEAIARHVERAPAHHAPIFGAVFGALGAGPEDAAAAFLHAAARGALSAGVRLGLVGPLEAQAILASRAELCERVLARSATIAVADAAQTSPLVELFGALHDALDGRLFQS